MDWISNMQNAINYIEDNLLEEISYDKIAQRAYSSTYHFQRMFSMLTGFTIGEYIRRRRLTLAAQEISVSSIKIADIASKYGYETSEAFTKAFKRLHGVTPSVARESGVKLKSFARLTIQVSLKGDKEINYRIVEKGPFKVFGKDFKTNVLEGRCFREIPEFWEQCKSNGIFAKLLTSVGKDESGIVDAGVLFNHNPQDGSLRYMIACEFPVTHVPEEFQVLEIPSMTWAIFEVESNRDEDLHEVWRRIGSEWFPASNYEHADAPELERYYGNSSTDYTCQIWIPVIKKGF
ncbi:AraC family transcriptional regulator [Alkalicella caledoniensis]|uniref:AraC family transcriptional regulator n=1 Tax=Alkalicella caledoniensis TaxID=2731377 RepID=A0A7G9W9M1_ALKCA|nr:AraC family transcriptional regulator [Alkalicella caledoniensis]QNO15383.1 AraC family transcriptional regulator [Alkalicella caledoniensis]